jgi:hypothetical protein
MSKKKQKPSYEVGRGKPPQSGRWVKGQSGNPGGRPKGSKNFSTMIQNESRRTVRINTPDGTRTVTKLEAALMQMGNKAAQGHLPSQREFFNLVQRSEETSSAEGKQFNLEEADEPVKKSLLKQMQEIARESISTSEPKKEEKDDK